MTKSTAVTTILVSIFVVVVIYALVLTYLPVKQSGSSTNTESIYTSALTLISGSASSISFNKTCSGDTYLQIYVTNNSPDIYYVTNVTLSAYHSKTTSTVLVPISNGCIPVSESRPEIPEGANDVFVQTYPEVDVPPYTGWNVTISFSNGQNTTQPDLTAQPE